MKSILFVMAGGATGAVLRYLLARSIPSGAGGWPWPTFLANILGGFAMGLLAVLELKNSEISNDMRLLLGVGLLGGFTTFSAFSLEMMTMIEQGNAAQAAIYAIASVLIALMAVFAGAGIGRVVVG